MNPKIPRLVATLALSLGSRCQAQATVPIATPISTEATLYSTLPSSAAHRPEMAMDSDPNSFFQSAYSMESGDDEFS